ncbi:MAG: FHA domain-containing protein [Myxococcota bacterium]
MATLFRLVIEDDEGKTTIFPLGSRAVTIGRRAGNTIRLMERNVSRRHARVGLGEDGAVRVEDLDSYNGIFVNGERIDGQVPMGVGDVVGIGGYSVVLEAQTEEEEEEAPRPADTLVDPGAGIPEHPTDPGEASTPASTPHLDAPGLPLRVARPRLIVVRSSLAGRSFVLGEDRTLVGRGVEADLVIDHPSISRLHAAVEGSEGGLRIDDLGSANGIRVDGQLVASHRLQEGQLLELGDVGMRFVPAHTPFVPTDEDVRALEQVGVSAPAGMVDASAALTLPDPLLVQKAAAREQARSADEETLRRAPAPEDGKAGPAAAPPRARAPAPAAWTGARAQELEALRSQVDGGSSRSTWVMAAIGLGLLILAGLGGTWFLIDSGRAVQADSELQSAFERGDDEAVLDRYDRDKGRFADPEQAALTRDRSARRRGMSLAREGVEAFRQGRVEEAVEALLRCIELASELSVCHRNLAVAYTRQERYDDAARHYRLFLDLEPNHPEGEAIQKILVDYEGKRQELDDGE